MKGLLYILILLFSMTTISNESSAAIQINYEVSFPEAQAHYIDVKMNVSGIKKDYLDIKMPVWAPGSYLVREFAKNVEGFSVKGPGNTALSFQKSDKNTWRINTGKSNNINISYRVYAFELSVRTSFVDASHAFLSTSGVFMYIDDLINIPASITIEPHSSWKTISTGLEAVKGKKNTFYAPDFDILYDSPIEVGNQEVFEFNAAGTKHQVAMYGGGNYDKARLSADMTKIIEAETSMFGENPNKRYVFIVHNTLNGGGGLEHLNSTVLGAKRNAYSDENSYKGFLGLVAHEYFHLWNVKRLRPIALGPFNYDAENYTTNLWIAEGFTAYYDNLTLRRTGIFSPEKYLEVISADINTVENQPGNKFQPVSEASFDAWIKYYRPHENSRNSTISYYDKGSLLGMIIDLEILGATKGQKGLDDVMKAMYDEYYKKQKRGYTDAEFRAMAEKFAGRSLEKIYTDYVNGTQPISYNSYLGHAGIYMSNESKPNVPMLGISSALRDGKLIVTSVARNSTAWNGGLNVNDELIAIDNNRIITGTDQGKSDLDRLITSKKVGDKIKVLITRDGIIQTLDLTLAGNPYARFKLELDNNATAEQLVVRKRWLNL